MKPELKIGWATHEAAKFACENWHYTGKIPVNKLVKVGAWENGKFIGVVIFGMGASAVVHKQFKLGRFEVCELVRVALTAHATPVSRIIAIALKFLKKANPGLRVCVSFADPAQGHHGGIYQAGGWVYTGNSAATKEYFFNGDWRHVTDVYKRLSPEKVKGLRSRTKPGKYRYVMGLDDDMKRILSLDARPYPKRAPEALTLKRPRMGREGGSSPTPALQTKKGKRDALP
jgi:hypothetical protein